MKLVPMQEKTAARIYGMKGVTRSGLATQGS
jgi:hypothetical protein